MIFDIRDYGAVNDGKTVNTTAIQSAVDACTAAGGGQVLVAGGKYMTGTICLKNGVELHLAADGVIFGSPDCADYPERDDLKHVTTALLPRKRCACVIFAEECENISITGNGVIDCNGTEFITYRGDQARGWPYDRVNAPTPPRVVFFTGCRNVKVTDITITNQPAGWTYWIHDCDYVTIDRCKIIAEVLYPNNDGIHINSSRNVTVSNCLITCGDDCIIVRANNSSLKENKVCEKVTVTNCNLTSYSGGIRVGWINDGTIRNCTFSNLVMTDTSVGISILLPALLPPDGETRISDQGREDTLIDNLSFDNIIMDGIYRRPVKIHVQGTVVDGKQVVRCKGIQNLYFTNIHSRGATYPRINGREDCRLKNIYFNNCTFERVGDDVLTNQLQHGDGSWGDRTPLVIENADNVVFNNTAFTDNKH